MAPSNKLTDYERLRLENIKRNEEVLAALKIPSRLSDLSAAKRPRVQNKSYKVSPEKKLKSETPIVLRRSLRTQGKAPDASTSGGLKDDFDESMSNGNPGFRSSLRKLLRECVPINMKDAYSGENHDSNQMLIETIKGLLRKSQLNEGTDQKPIFKRSSSSVDFESSKLEPKNVSDEGADKKPIVCDLKQGRMPSSSVDIKSLKLEPENIAEEGADQDPIVYDLMQKIMPSSSVEIESLKLESESIADEGADQKPIFYNLKQERMPSSLVDIKSLKLEQENIAAEDADQKPIFYKLKQERMPSSLVDIKSLKLEPENITAEDADQKPIFYKLKQERMPSSLVDIKSLKLEPENIAEEGADQKPIFNNHKQERRPSSPVDIESLRLEPENIARVVPGRILNVKFFPTTAMRMVVVGNKFGNVGFWNADAKEEDGVGIYLYQPHSGPVSGIVIDPFSISKMVTSCYDGFIRMMDIEKELFDSLYSSDHPIFALSQSPDNMNSLYYAEGYGKVGRWDLRAGKCSSSWDLHEDRINSIDFNLENNNILATSSTDGTVCIWDMRKADKKSKSLRTIHHERAVHSAYFSRSGNFLASTSFDDNIGLSSGANYEDLSMIRHNNHTGRWISSFRAIWGWDDSYIFVGNMQRGVDVISTDKKVIVLTLQSEHMSAIQCRFDAHQYKVGMLAGATSGGQVYIWMPS